MVFNTLVKLVDPLPNPYNGPQPAQMGNLNKDSTHPNPWYPPTEYERIQGMATPYRIFHSPNDPIGPVKPLRNFLEQDDLLTNIRWAAWKGLGIGIVLGLNDIIIVNQIDTLRARWARMSYIVPPYVAATVSFVCAREALGNISAEKNAPWTYPAAMVAPGTIYGIAKNSFDRGLRFTFFGAIAAATYKWNIDHGGMLFPKGSMFNFQEKNLGMMENKGARDFDHENNRYKETQIWAEGWRGWPFKMENRSNWWTPREEPGWKKHVSKEEAERGPGPLE